MKSEDLDGQRAALVTAAQTVLNDWVQDENGFDEELGEGGACDLIADAMVSVLSEAGVEDAISLHSEMDGGHTFVVARLDDGVFTIDIPPSVYETGAGYVWRKREGVVLREGDIAMMRIEPPMSTEMFAYRYCEGPDPAEDENAFGI